LGELNIVGKDGREETGYLDEIKANPSVFRYAVLFTLRA
jgi:hypothetical protein